MEFHVLVMALQTLLPALLAFGKRTSRGAWFRWFGAMFRDGLTLMCRPSHQAQLPACPGNGFLERCPGYIPSFGERFRTKRTHRLSRPSASCHVRSCVAKLQLLPSTPTIVVFIPELCSTHFRCRCPISCRQGCVTCCFHSIDAQLQFVGPSA